ncbi:hypothetical protein [Diaphorobacter ruginosibacter]|uniref:hypothetical protein n=1 Tax=Diaphorobacter ruginosibacter TaxID=1715720 RepID=UPI00333F5FC4
MIKAEQGPWKYLILWLRYYYAIHFLKSGINFAVFGVIPDFSKAGAVGPYMHEMNEVGFYPLVKYLEIVLGSMLLFNILVPVALAFMAGIAFQIIYLNLFVSPHPRQLFTGTQELLLCGLLILAYGKNFAGLFQLRAKPGFPWQQRQSAVTGSPAVTGMPVYAARSKDMVLLIAVAVVWTVVVIGFSTTMGSRPLRIYDWGPPMGALLLALFTMFMDRRGSAPRLMDREAAQA